jgi:general secretion pathway protein D
MAKRFAAAVLVVGICALLAACPKGNADYKAGKKAEAIADYDTALMHYERALKADPLNAEYRLKASRIRFEAGQAHVDAGRKLRTKGDLPLAVAELEKAMAIDPASAVAAQELKATLEMIAARNAAAAPGGGDAPPEPEPVKLMAEPPTLMPLSRDPINLKVTNDARIVFETIGKLAGLTVVFDPEFQSRRITTELTSVTLEQALDVVSLQAKAFWKPITSNIIFISSDSVQKRKDFEEYVVKTFYLDNTIAAQDLTEIVNGLRQILDLRKVQQINALNAIIIRDTVDKIRLAEKILADIDKAKPEVVIQVSVLQARRDRARDLGITPGSSAVLSFTPRNPTGSDDDDTAANQIRLNDLQRLSSADYSITLPGAAATALITDSATRIIQNPEIRVVDGQSAKLNVGDRVPIATGSFQAGLGGTVGGVGTGGAGAGFVNPLVNTQFQYIDVGVNINITPRIHNGREISMKVQIEVSSVAGRVNIGGIEQPIISQRKIEHDIRLQEGEVNVLGGIVERSQTKSISGWPGLSKIPFLRYLFSTENVDSVESEVLIVLTPRIVRLPQITAENLRSLSAGTDTNVRVRSEDNAIGPVVPPPAAQQQPAPGAQAPAPPGSEPARRPVVPPSPGGTPAPPAQQPGPEGPMGRLRFAPEQISVGVGQTITVGLVAENVEDLFSIPLLLQYDPKVISIEEVRHGGFLSGGTQEIAIVQRIDPARGQAIVSATRQPNTPGVSGSGTLVGIVIKGLAAGQSPLAVVQVNARNSQQKAIQLVSSEAVVQVQ